MDGWWDAEDLPGLCTRLLTAGLDQELKTLDTLLAHLKARFINLQRGERAFEIGKVHYDLGNDLFQAMLGERLVYSCGYWAKADNLDDAQAAKLDLVCRKLQLKTGQRVLDIGCGWGEALKYRCRALWRRGRRHHHVAASRPTMPASCAPACRSRSACRTIANINEPLRCGLFHRHVRARRRQELPHLFRNGATLPEGRRPVPAAYHRQQRRPAQTDPWIEKYIFPNSMIPAASQVAAALEDLFVVEDWHNFGTDYDRTLMAWHDNIEAAWPPCPPATTSVSGACGAITSPCPPASSAAAAISFGSSR